MSLVSTRMYDHPDEALAALPSVEPGDLVVLFTLGFEPAACEPIARAWPEAAEVFLADCYGIVGYCAEDGSNHERLEKGCGREYGGIGGEGGRGVVLVRFAASVSTGAADRVPSPGALSHLAVTTHGRGAERLLAAQLGAPYYGGVAKQTYRFAHETESFEPVTCFCIGHHPSSIASVGLTGFTGEAGPALAQLLEAAPGGSAVEAVALFPCFMRGVNKYGAHDVEPRAVAQLLPGTPVFGMFCHGELGPGSCLGFDPTAPPQGVCSLQSMTTIAAVYIARR